jgi:hypothetical protein
MPVENLTEVIASYRQNLQYNAKDEDLKSAINKALVESFELKDKIDDIGKRNKRYWVLGTDKDLKAVHPKKSKLISNRIFTDVETAIPILTSEPPEPTVIGNITNEQRTKIQKGLELAYEVKYRMQQKLQCLLRHWFLFRLGALKYRWDEDRGFITENTLPKKIGFDKRATSKDDCEYFWEELEDTAGNIIEKFPKVKNEIVQLAGEKGMKSKMKYIEFWGGKGEWVCWKLREIILDKIKNPNWDYENEENNIFKKPQFPFILMNVFSIGDETGMYDETSLIEQSIPILDGANQLEQQIIDLNEGQKRVWVVSGEAMSEKKAQDLVDKTGDLMVYLDRKAPAGSVAQVQSGKPDASLFDNLTHLLGEIDNIMGIHSTTRGERAQQETLGGRQLLMGSDMGRLDLIVRNVETVIEEWYNAYLHMIKVYSVGGDVLRSATNEQIELKPEDIPNDVSIMVKKGSTLPIDDRTKMDNAIQLASAGMIDPKTLFEEMGYPNTDQRVQDLYQWLQMTGKIIPQQQQMPQGSPEMAGQPAQPTPEQAGMPVGQGVGQPPIQQGGQADQQLARLNQVLQSPQFQSLPDDQKLAFIQRGKEIIQQIKQGA